MIRIRGFNHESFGSETPTSSDDHLPRGTTKTSSKQGSSALTLKGIKMGSPAALHQGLVAILLVTMGCRGGGLSGHRAGGPTARNQSDTPGDPAHNLLHNMDFASGSMLPWLTSFSSPADGVGLVKNGALCVNVGAAGTNRWDAQVRHR